MGYKEQMEFTAPDGGWGWMIVLGTGISNMVLLSILQTFGLVFMDRLQQLEFTVTDITSIISVNSSFGMIMGILNGPLLKRFGYRKMAFVGGVLYVAGLCYTAFAESYIEYLISYGMVSSLGMTVSMSSFSLALNTYFKLKRSTAASLSVTIMGMGPIVLPLLVTQLLSSYGWRWTLLILTAGTLNTFVGALLLQPVKWHLRKENVDLEQSRNNSILEKIRKQTLDSHSLFDHRGSFLDPTDIVGSSQLDLSDRKWKSQNSLQKSKISNHLGSSDPKSHQANNGPNRMLRSITSLDNDDYTDMMKSLLYITESSTPKGKLIKCASIETLDEHIAKNISHESEKLLNNNLESCKLGNEQSDKSHQNGVISDNDAEVKKIGVFRAAFNYIREIYDLDLLLDPIYINILIGLSTATVGEIIFSLLTPFVLIEMGINLDEAALCMSVVAITDVVFRILSPYFGKCLKLNSRMMFMIAIFILLLNRASLFLAKSLTGFIVVALGLGIGKGLRTVYWVLVIPDYVPLYQLASASAFQSLVNGISLLISGPIIGYIIKRNNNRYTNVIYASNFLTFIAIAIWGIEFLIVYRKRRKSKDSPST